MLLLQGVQVRFPSQGTEILYAAQPGQKKKKFFKLKTLFKKRKALTRVRMGGVGCPRGVGSYQSLMTP